MSSAPQKTRTRFFITTGLLVAAAAAAWFFIDWGALHDRAHAMNGWLVFLLLAFLPLLGVPASVLLYVVGARFGPVQGVLLTIAATLIHLFASYVIARHLLHDLLKRWLAKAGFRLPRVPHGGNAITTLFVALLPGPYVVKNYLLPLGGVPLWTFVGICLPIHVGHALVALLLGHFSSEFTPGRIAFLIAYVIGMVLLGRQVARIWKKKQRAGPHDDAR